MTYRLWGMPGSPFTRKAQVFLELKGLEVEDVFTNIFPVDPKLAAVNPMRRVPVLELPDGRHLADTSAICLYLEAQHPNPPLYPSDAFLRSRALMFEEYADTTLAAVVGLGVFRPLVLGPMLGKPIDDARVRKALEVKLPRIFAAFEAELDGRKWFYGDAIGITDIAVATQVVNLHFAGFEIDVGAFPALRDLCDRALALPAFMRRVDAERKLIPPAAKLP